MAMDIALDTRTAERCSPLSRSEDRVLGCTSYRADPAPPRSRGCDRPGEVVLARSQALTDMPHSAPLGRQPSPRTAQGSGRTHSASSSAERQAPSSLGSHPATSWLTQGTPQGSPCSAPSSKRCNSSCSTSCESRRLVSDSGSRVRPFVPQFRSSSHGPSGSPVGMQPCMRCTTTGGLRYAAPCTSNTCRPSFPYGHDTSDLPTVNSHRLTYGGIR